MENDFEADLITLIDDDGEEHEFEIVGELENDDGHFFALVPTRLNPEEAFADAESYYIFEVVEDDEGEEMLQEVENNDLFYKLAEIFEDQFNDLYFDRQDEDD